MNDGYVKTDPWRLVEDRFDPSRALSSESLFALGNGVMGGRANFEERYSGETLQGNYIGGVYYPDKTRVGWWKNGYPEYFAKVLNAAFWIGVDVGIDGEPLDLATVAEVKSFYRETDMRRSVLTRRMTVTMRNGAEVAVEATRFLSLTRRELGVVRYAVTPLNRAAAITFSPHIDADVRNADANYDEKFWEPVLTDGDVTQSRTRKSGFEAAWAQAVELEGAEFRCETQPEKVRHTAAVRCAAGRMATLYKYAGICSSLNHAPADLAAAARAVAAEQHRSGVIGASDVESEFALVHIATVERLAQDESSVVAFRRITVGEVKRVLDRPRCRKHAVVVGHRHHNCGSMAIERHALRAISGNPLAVPRILAHHEGVRTRLGERCIAEGEVDRLAVRPSQRNSVGTR